MSLLHEESLNRPSRDTYYVLKKVKWGVRRLNLTRKVRFFSLFFLDWCAEAQRFRSDGCFLDSGNATSLQSVLLWFASPRPRPSFATVTVQVSEGY